MNAVITAKAKLIEILGLANFSGAGNIVAHKQDVFERPGGSVSLAKLTSDRLTMSESTFERMQWVQVTVSETFDTGDTEDQLLALALEIEAAVEVSLLAGGFADGVIIGLTNQAIEIIPDDSTTGVITQIYSIEYTQTLT